MKKTIIIISAIILIPVLLFAIFGLPISVLEGFVIPTENVKCGDSMVVTILKKGMPNEVDTSSFDITGSITFEYYNQEIMEMNMSCRYRFRHNGLCYVGYTTDFDSYNKEEFVDTVNNFMKENLDDTFEKSQPWSEEDDNGNTVDYYEYSYSTGATYENIYIVADDNTGFVKIDFMF